MALETMEVDLEEIPEDLHAIGVMNGRGHTSHVWKKSDPEQVKEAQLLFSTLTSHGYKAYRMDKKGNQGEPMDTFDPDAKRMLFAPPFQGG